MKNLKNTNVIIIIYWLFPIHHSFKTSPNLNTDQNIKFWWATEWVALDIVIEIIS